MQQDDSISYCVPGMFYRDAILHLLKIKDYFKEFFFSVSFCHNFMGRYAIFVVFEFNVCTSYHSVVGYERKYIKFYIQYYWRKVLTWCQTQWLFILIQIYSVHYNICPYLTAKKIWKKENPSYHTIWQNSFFYAQHIV